MYNYIKNPPDGGMRYTETNMGQFFPEPLNAITSCFFLAIAIYWTVKLWGRGRQYTFLSITVLLLYVGGIGGIIYHGLRRWNIFIMMDWLPIMLLCLAAGLYFLTRLTRWYYGMLLILGYIIFQVFARRYIRVPGNMQLYININYAIMAAIVLVPVVAYLISTRFRHGRWVGLALAAFICALTFRVADGWGWLQSGTHFLWHSFGAVAAFCMFQYLYLINSNSGI